MYDWFSLFFGADWIVLLDVLRCNRSGHSMLADSRGLFWVYGGMELYDDHFILSREVL